MGCISVHTERVGGTLRVCTVRTGGTLRVSVSVVCTADIEEGYVRTGSQCVWLTEDNLWEAAVAVESNRQWTAG